MKELKVGATRRDITPPLGTMLQGYTPPRPATSVHDGVSITAFAFESNEERALLFSVEMCNLPERVQKRLKEALTEATAIDGKKMIIACTHTHSSAHAVIDFDEPHNFIKDTVIPMAVEAAKDALSNMKNAEMGIGTAYCDIAVNRREIVEETGMAKLGQNPYGPFDPTMTLISFRETDGKPIGNIIHYGCHNTVAGNTGEITRDWAGVMVDRLENESGALTAFINGCGGDCGPRLPNGKTTGDIEMAQELGRKAGDFAMRAFNAITVWEKDIPMQIHSAPISLPLKDVGSAESVLNEAAKLGDPEKLKGTLLSSYRNLIKRAEYLKEGNIPEKEKIIDHTFIALGDLVLEGMPFEPFSIITLRIKNGSPFKHTLCVGYANGSLSYFPSMDQIIRGGYEVRMFRTCNLIPFDDDSEQHYVTGSLSVIRDMYKKQFSE